MLQQNYLWNKKGIYPEACDEVVQEVRQRWYDVHPQLLWDSCEDKRTKVGRSDANFGHCQVSFLVNLFFPIYPDSHCIGFSRHDP